MYEVLNKKILCVNLSPQFFIPTSSKMQVYSVVNK